MESKAVWLLTGLCLLLWPPEPAAAQAGTWQVHVDAGQKAFDELRYQEAEEHYLAALKEAGKLGGEDARHADSLNRLALLYRAQDKYDEAEPLFLHSLAIFENVFGPMHSNVATCLNNLAELHRSQGRYQEAESLFQRSLDIQKKTLSPQHPELALTLNNLALIYHTQGRYEEA